MNRFGSLFKPLMWFVALLLAVFVAGCGGGGGESASPSPSLDCSSGSGSVETVGGTSTTRAATTRTYSDDYPYPNADYNVADPWQFFYKECTSFVAWRMNRDASTRVAPYFFRNDMKGDGRLWGNAGHWDENAVSLGYRVDQLPEVGAIAQWNSTDLANGGLGHVAYVEMVNSDNSVDVSEYNYHLDHKFGYRLNIRPPRFIHIQ